MRSKADADADSTNTEAADRSSTHGGPDPYAAHGDRPAAAGYDHQYP